MGHQELNLGKDSDHMAMLMDRRSLLQQIKDFIKSRIGNKNEWDQVTQEQEGVRIIPEDPII